MTDCFLRGYGSCGRKISGEHYISKTVLEAINPNGTIQIGGLPWQTPQTLQTIGIGSLVSNVLCETHNSALSKFDGAAGTFFRALDSVDKRPLELPPLTAVDGPLIEGWFLKVMCGLAAGPGFNNRMVPEEWKSVLSGSQWPDGWGLYVPALDGPQVLATEFSVETLVNPSTKSVLAAVFRVAGVSFNLLFGRPDNPTVWGTYRPRGLIFRNGQTEKRIEFVWPFSTDQTVIYTRFGTTKDRPPQWHGWREFSHAVAQPIIPPDLREKPCRPVNSDVVHHNKGRSLMTKTLITEQRLIDAINLALRHDWPHKDWHCEVSALRKVEYPKRNWEVETTSAGGANLLHTEECDRLLDRVLNELVGKYDVQWPT